MILRQAQDDTNIIKISIITVVYNGAQYLEQAMHSVFNQRYPNIEYIVLDGASTDGTQAIIRKYEAKLSYWISEPDAGMYHAINKGIGVCTGDLIGLLNSDDWLEPDAILKVVDGMQKNPGGDVYHGIVMLTNEQGIPQREMESTIDFLDKGMIGHPACFISREAYQKFGMYNLSYQSAADYELMLRFRKANACFVHTKSILANFRVHAGGKSNSVRAAFETIAIRYRYGLISGLKGLMLFVYWMFIKKG